MDNFTCKSNIRSNRERMFCRSLSWMRGGTAGTGKSCALAPVGAKLRWLPAGGVDCGDNAAAVIGRGADCTASTVVPLRVPGVDWMRDGLTDIKWIKHFITKHNVLTGTSKVVAGCSGTEVALHWVRLLLGWVTLLICKPSWFLVVTNHLISTQVIYISR